MNFMQRMKWDKQIGHRFTEGTQLFENFKLSQNNDQKGICCVV